MSTQSLRSIFLPVAGVLATALLIAGCGDSFFGVDNPGQIQEADLNSEEALEAVVTGMSSDLTAELDQIAFAGARLSDEMSSTGSYFITGRARRGIIEDDDVDTYWEGIQRARFSAESGIERMRNVLGENFGDRKELGARALLFAGLTNRVYGENFNRVVFEGGQAQSRTAAFERAIPFLENAESVAETAGAEDIMNAARGGLAQVYMNLGNWSEARSYAEQVPTDFVYNALYSRNSGREENEVFDETHERYEMSAIETLAGEIGGPDDPRVPYTDCRGNVDGGPCTAENGAGGNNPHLRQEKYQSLGDDIPLVKGTEMRLIEAEAALRGEGGPDFGTFADQINEVRSFHELAPIEQPTELGELEHPISTDDGDALSILDRERHLTLWLEGRRLNDLTRWDHPFLNGGGLAYTSNIASERASIMPVAESECDNNENVECPAQAVYTP